MSARAGFDRDFGADAVAIRSRADSLHPQHVILISVVIAQQPRRTVIGRDQQIQIAIIIKIGISSAAANDRPLAAPGQVSRSLLQTCSCPGCGKDAAAERI